MPATTKVERSRLTATQSKKLDGVVTSLAKSLKIKADGQANLRRFADKYLRFKLGVRGTGPHSHGFNADQRKAITGAVREAFGIKEQLRKAASKPAAKKGGNKRGSTRKSTAALAKEQKARAEGHPIPGTQVVRQGS